MVSQPIQRTALVPPTFQRLQLIGLWAFVFGRSTSPLSETIFEQCTKYVKKNALLEIQVGLYPINDTQEPWWAVPTLSCWTGYVRNLRATIQDRFFRFPSKDSGQWSKGYPGGKRWGDFIQGQAAYGIGPGFLIKNPSRPSMKTSRNGIDSTR